MANEHLLDQKEKLLLEYAISDSRILSQVYNIFKPEYFFSPTNEIVEFVRDYFYQYKSVPTPEVINGEFEIRLETHEVTDAIFQYALDEIEEYAKNKAIRNAIEQGIDLLQTGKYSSIEQLIRDALRVQLDSSLGVSYFEDPETRIIESKENIEETSCGIDAIDSLIGNLKRYELGIVAGESGIGKSNILINILKNMAEKGFDCCYITLELESSQVGSRLDGMITGYPINDTTEYPAVVAEDLEQLKDSYGDIMIKKLPSETTPAEIMAYLVEYQIQRGRYPDVLIVDYLDEMGPDDPKKQTLAEIEKHITARLSNIINEIGAYGITASQLIKDATDITKINRSHVSGGAFKVNKSDWTIAAFATEEDVDNNLINFTQIKIRSSSKDKHPKTAYINPKNLIISNNPKREKDIKTKSANKYVPSALQDTGQEGTINASDQDKEQGDSGEANVSAVKHSDLVKRKLAAKELLSKK